MNQALRMAATYHAQYKEALVPFLLELRPLADQAALKGDEQNHFAGVLHRAIAWALSLSRLDEPYDFQAVVAASRALFEMTVDLVLLHFDPNGYPLNMILTWEESAQLKAAERVVKYHDDRGITLPAHHKIKKDFIAREGATIEAKRIALWPSFNGRHPDRWTSHNLGVDADAAEVLWPGHGLAEYYSARYPELNWNLHGSGLAGIRKIRTENFPAIGAFALEESSRFLRAIAELVLRRIGWTAEYETAMQKLEEKMGLASAAAWLSFQEAGV